MPTLEEVAAELYSLPLQDFVAERNARAKALKADHTALAAQVAKLPKPVAAAHLLNVFAHEHDDLLDELLALGADLREAQQERDRERLQGLTTSAAQLMRRALAAIPGDDPGVEQTLRAAMADEQAAAAVRAGVLVRPLAPAGFGPVDLTGSVAVSPAQQAPKARTVRTPAKEQPDRRVEAREAQQREEAEARNKAAAVAAEREVALEAAVQAHQAATAQVRDAEAALETARQAERAAAKHERAARQERDKAARRAVIRD